MNPDLPNPNPSAQTEPKWRRRRLQEVTMTKPKRRWQMLQRRLSFNSFIFLFGSLGLLMFRCFSLGLLMNVVL